MGCASGSCSTGGFGAVKTLIGVVVLAGGAWLGYNFATTGYILGSSDKDADSASAFVETSADGAAATASAGALNACSDKDKADCELECGDDKVSASASACSDQEKESCALSCDSEDKVALTSNTGEALCCKGDKPITECVPSECDGEGKACCIAAFAAAGLEMPATGSIASNAAGEAGHTGCDSEAASRCGQKDKPAETDG